MVSPVPLSNNKCKLTHNSCLTDCEQSYIVGLEQHVLLYISQKTLLFMDTLYHFRAFYRAYAFFYHWR